MKLTKKTIYGMLLCLYLDRAGRATAQTMASAMGIPCQFMRGIAFCLVKKGLLLSVRGPFGGFELVRPNITVLEIFKALEPASKPFNLTMSTSVEKRALQNFLMDAADFFHQGLNLPIKTVNQTLVQSEIDRLSDTFNMGSA